MLKKFITVSYGERSEQWTKWMKKSLKKNYAESADLTVISPSLQDIHQSPATQRSAYWKARATGRAPAWILDSDLLVLSPMSWEPEDPEVRLAMARGGDVMYLEFIRKAGLYVRDETSLNCGVIWARDDMFAEYERIYTTLFPHMTQTTYSIGETTWNALWHELSQKGQAKLLPQSYNQIISEHGPHQAVIFHLAGAPEHFKTQLMESYYRHFFGEPDL